MCPTCFAASHAAGPYGVRGLCPIRWYEQAALGFYLVFPTPSEDRMFHTLLPSSHIAGLLHAERAVYEVSGGMRKLSSVVVNNQTVRASLVVRAVAANIRGFHASILASHFARSIPTFLTFSMAALPLHDNVRCYHPDTLRWFVAG